MAKRTTTTTGATKRARKTAPRKTARRTGARTVKAAETMEAAAAVESVGVAASPTGPTAEQIAERAYFLSLERKGPGGPLDDWLQAERELRNGSIPL